MLLNVIVVDNAAQSDVFGVVFNVANLVSLITSLEEQIGCRHECHKNKS
jgi:hypothetical protein